MPFQALFLAHAPDADLNKHQAFIDTGKYHLDVVMVKNQAEALAVVANLHKLKKLDSIILCPGFTHKDLAEIVALTDGKVAVCPARGDGPSSRIALDALRREGMVS
ncbi:MAG: hypothetical protein JW843_00885 [Candidatus Aminicenantes bacterium]|nr:hypothetical protein [Candidatus Aminicenantes bacterium]